MAKKADKKIEELMAKLEVFQKLEAENKLKAAKLNADKEADKVKADKLNADKDKVADKLQANKDKLEADKADKADKELQKETSAEELEK